MLVSKLCVGHVSAKWSGQCQPGALLLSPGNGSRLIGHCLECEVTCYVLCRDE